MIDVRQRGAAADGVTDDTAILQSCLADAIYSREPMYLAAGHYRYSDTLHITAPVTIRGDGHRTSVLTPDPTFDGFAITVDDCWRNFTEQAAAETVDWDEARNGVTLQHFGIVGHRSAPAGGIVTTGICDNLILHDLFLAYLNGTALALASRTATATLRESAIRRVIVRGCGNQIEAAVELSAGVDNPDSTNMIEFTDLDLNYPHGVGLRIWQQSLSGSELRRVAIRGFRLHGLHNAANAAPADLMRVEGKVTALTVSDFHCNGSTDVGGVKYAAVRFLSNPSGRPNTIVFDGDHRVHRGDGYVIEDANLLRITGTVQPLSIQGDEVRFEDSSVPEAAHYGVLGPTSGRTRVVHQSVADRVTIV